MAATLHPVPEAPARCLAPCMSRCECTGISFEELARLKTLEGLSVEETARRTGCGQTCTACLPDLKAYLASRT
jgi:bacterioferritin-associated ferredoxin